MSDFRELVQLRWNAGQLQYRQRERVTEWFSGADGEEYPQDVISDGWSNWQGVPAVKGDSSDERFK